MKGSLFFKVAVAVCVWEVSYGWKPFFNVGKGSFKSEEQRNVFNNYEGECSPLGPIPQCAADVCVGETCGEHEDAVCMVNICGGCTKIWFDEEGNELEDCPKD